MTINPRYILDNAVLRLTVFGCQARAAVVRDNNSNHSNSHHSNSHHNNHSHSNNNGGMGRGVGRRVGIDSTNSSGDDSGTVTYSPLAVLNLQDADAGGGDYLLLAMCARGMWYAATHLISSETITISKSTNSGVPTNGRAGIALGCVSIVACGEVKDHRGEWGSGGSGGGDAGSRIAYTIAGGKSGSASGSAGAGASSATSSGVIGTGVSGTGPTPGPSAVTRPRVHGALTSHTPSIPPPPPLSAPLASSHTTSTHGPHSHPRSTHHSSIPPSSTHYWRGHITAIEPLSLCWADPSTSSLLDQGMDLYRLSIDQNSPQTPYNNNNNNNNNNNTSSVKENSWGGSDEWGCTDVTRLAAVSPLHFAMRAGRMDVVKLLMGVDYNEEEDDEEGEGGSKVYQQGSSNDYHHHGVGISSGRSHRPSPGPRSISRWVDSMDVRTLHPLLLHALTEGLDRENEDMQYHNPHHNDHNHHHNLHKHSHPSHHQHNYHLLARRAVRAGSRMTHPHHHPHPHQLTHPHTTSGFGAPLAIEPQFTGPLAGLCTVITTMATTTTPTVATATTTSATATAKAATAIAPSLSTPLIALMDGTAMSLTSFTEHQSNLALALPAPRLARGVGHSGTPLINIDPSQNNPISNTPPPPSSFLPQKNTHFNE